MKFKLEIELGSNALRTKIRAALGFAYPKSGAFTF